jgi:predicted ATPase
MVVDNVLQSIGDRGSKNTMIYLSSFMLSNKQVKNPNIYPYNVFRGKYIEPFVFSPITVFYGNNGSGKSTLLNIIANRLQLNGKEYATSNSFGIVDYCNAFSNECSYSLGEDDFGFVIKNLPGNSRYIKSEDILYEIKKIQQKQVLSDGMEYDYVQKGMTIQEAKDFLSSKEGRKQEEYIKFAQEKYSNGETSMQYFEEYLQPNALYLLDEPEVSLSPSNQVLLANEINKLARLLECQFVIATHSPFMLGTLNAKIYNIDTKEYDVVKWNELENVQYFYNFFKKHEQEFL